MNRKSRVAAFTMICALIFLVAGSASGAIDVPAKLKDIPLFQGAKVEQAMDMENHAMLTAKVKAKPDDIAAFYKKAMTEKGWKVFMQTEQENVKLIHFTKDNQLLQVNIQSEQGEDGVTLAIVMTSK